MLKPMLVGAVALALSGSSLVMAQQRPAPATPQAPGTLSQAPAPTPSAPKATPQPPGAQGSPAPGSPAPGSSVQSPSAEDRAAAARRDEEADEQAEFEGRIASMKAGLMLTDAQAKFWPAFEKAYREFAKVRMDTWRERSDQQRSDNPLENMQARAEFAIRRGTAMKEFTDAAMPLYDSLDPGQQRRFRNDAFRGLMMAHHGSGRGGGYGYGPRWRDRDGDDDRRSAGPRWRDREDDDRGYGQRWGGRGGGCDGGRHGWHHRWHHRGEGMMGPRGGWRDNDDNDRRGSRWRDQDDGNDRRGSGWRGRDDEGSDRRGSGWRGRDEDGDRRGNNSDDDSDDSGNNGRSNRRSSADTDSGEERL